MFSNDKSRKNTLSIVCKKKQKKMSEYTSKTEESGCLLNGGWGNACKDGAKDFYISQ